MVADEALEGIIRKQVKNIVQKIQAAATDYEIGVSDLVNAHPHYSFGKEFVQTDPAVMRRKENRSGIWNATYHNPSRITTLFFDKDIDEALLRWAVEPRGYTVAKSYQTKYDAIIRPFQNRESIASTDYTRKAGIQKNHISLFAMNPEEQDELLKGIAKYAFMRKGGS